MDFDSQPFKQSGHGSVTDAEDQADVDAARSEIDHAEYLHEHERNPAEDAPAPKELHDLCRIFPLIRGVPFEALKADIREKGLLEPIVLYEGKILDGANRYRACQESGVAPAFCDYPGNDPVGFVESKNLHRRSLTPGQRAVAVSAMQDWSEAFAHGGNRGNDQVARVPLEARAEKAKVSPRTQRKADLVIREAPALAHRIDAEVDGISLNQAVDMIGEPKGEVGARTPEMLADEVAPEIKTSVKRTVSLSAAKKIAKLEARVVELDVYAEDMRSIAQDANEVMVALQALRDKEEFALIQGLQRNVRDLEHTLSVTNRQFEIAKKEVRRLKYMEGKYKTLRDAAASKLS